jgi:hypothetical protein
MIVRPLAILLLCAAAPLVAQSRGRIVGVVHDESGHPLPGADVTLRPLDRRARTDSAGQFEIAEVTLGKYTVQVRRLGYEARQAETTLVDSIARVTFTLKRRTVILDTVVVAGAACSAVTYQGFLCRKRGDHGTFFDFDTIDSLDSGNLGLGDLFRGLKGFRVESDSRGNRVPVATGGWQCLVSIVNGHEVTRANPLPVQLADVIGAEVYTDPKTVPDEYQRFTWIPARGNMPSRRCYVVAYWTE